MAVHISNQSSEDLAQETPGPTIWAKEKAPKVRVCVCRGMCVNTHTETRSQHGMSSSITLYLTFWDKVSHWTCSSWTSSPAIFPTEWNESAIRQEADSLQPKGRAQRFRTVEFPNRKTVHASLPLCPLHPWISLRTVEKDKFSLCSTSCSFFYCCSTAGDRSQGFIHPFLTHIFRPNSW